MATKAPLRLSATNVGEATTRSDQRILELVESNDLALAREEGRHNRLGQSWGVHLGLLGRRNDGVASIATELNMPALVL